MDKYEIIKDTVKAFMALVGAAILAWFRKKIVKAIKLYNDLTAIMEEKELMKKDIAKLTVDMLTLKFDGEQSKVERTIMKSERMADLYTGINPVFISNAKQEVIFVNPAWVKAFGMESERDALGFGYMAVIADNDRSFVREQREDQIQHAGSVKTEITFKHFITKQIIKTYCITDIVKHPITGEVLCTVGRLSIIKDC